MTTNTSEQTFSSGRKKSAFHIAKEKGGHAGLLSHRAASAADRVQALITEAEGWKDELPTEAKDFVLNLSKAMPFLKSAAGAICLLPKDWSPKSKKARGPSLEAGSIVKFKGTSEAVNLREALELAEDTTGKVVAVLPNKIITVDFGKGHAFPCKSSLFVEHAGADIVNMDEEKRKKAAEKARDTRVEELVNMGREKLRALAKKLKLKGYGSWGKGQLANEIADAEVK